MFSHNLFFHQKRWRNPIRQIFARKNEKSRTLILTSHFFHRRFQRMFFQTVSQAEVKQLQRKSLKNCIHTKKPCLIARLTSSSNEAEREFSCLSYQMGPTFMNQKAVHIERKQQTAEYDRFKKALTKIVMQQGIESSALGISKSAARIKI